MLFRSRYAQDSLREAFPSLYILPYRTTKYCRLHAFWKGCNVATPLVEKRKTRSDDYESIVLLGTARAMTSGRRVEEGTTRRNVKQGERRI